jgi:hypothetical protein
MTKTVPTIPNRDSHWSTIHIQFNKNYHFKQIQLKMKEFINNFLQYFLPFTADDEVPLYDSEEDIYIQWCM